VKKPIGKVLVKWLTVKGGKKERRIEKGVYQSKGDYAVD